MTCYLQNACTLILALSVACLTEGAPDQLFASQQPLQQQLPHKQQQELPIVEVDEFSLPQDFGPGQLRQSFTNQRGQQGQGGDNAPAMYEFAYDVKVPETQNDYGHAERRNGDTTQGMYRVLLPDGRIQVVTYTVTGNSGFVATVSYQ